MDIFLVPASRDRYELYCEVEDRRDLHDDGAPEGWRARLSRQFHRGLDYLESERRERLERAAAAESRTRVRKLRDRALGWLAERVAEQRLLWHLRGEREANVHHPDDCTGADAERIVRGEMRRDSRRHLAWMIVDALVYLASLPLTPIPGPNVLALYFSFRAIGHFLSWLGARHGLNGVRWAPAASPPLTELRRLPAMKPGERSALARDVASRLGLRHLDTFVERMTLAGP
jgi:hypothetical protein